MQANTQARRAIELLSLEGPPFAISMVVAELYFKFGTFTLEALAFLALWYALRQLSLKVWRRPGE